MKARLKAALEMLSTAAVDIRPGTMGEIQFKQAMVELQAAAEMPDPAPQVVEIKEVATDIVAVAVADRLAQVAQDNSEKVTALLQDLFFGVSSRLTNVETATASILQAGAATAEKIDGVSATLQSVVENTTRAPDPATAS